MVHAFFKNGYYIILDVNSGAVHVVDELAFLIVQKLKAPLSDECPSDILKEIGSFEKHEIKETYNEILGLYKDGLLFTEDFSRPIAQNIKEESPVKALCLHIAHDCNLRCGYCFAETGEYGGGRSMMSREVGFRAIDFVIENSKNRKNIEIDFFGGEPLMNFEVVRDIVDYARSKEKDSGKLFRFTITTNGLLLSDDVIEYINEHMSNVVISLDGRRDVNDKVRKTVSGQGSYDIILPKFLKLADSRNQDNYYIRGTFTKENLDFSKDVLHYSDLGFEQISIEPVVLCKDHPLSIEDSDLPKIFEEYDRLALSLLELKRKGIHRNFFHFMIDLEQGPCIIKRLRGCGSGSEYLAVTPEGDLYPCHQFVGLEEYKMGSVFNGIEKKDIKKTFESINLYTREDCDECFAKFYCSGGCIANSVKFEGDIKKPHRQSCELERCRVECAIMMKAAENA